MTNKNDTQEFVQRYRELTPAQMEIMKAIINLMVLLLEKEPKAKRTNVLINQLERSPEK